MSTAAVSSSAHAHAILHVAHQLMGQCMRKKLWLALCSIRHGLQHVASKATKRLHCLGAHMFTWSAAWRQACYNSQSLLHQHKKFRVHLVHLLPEKPQLAADRSRKVAGSWYVACRLPWFLWAVSGVPVLVMIANIVSPKFVKLTSGGLFALLAVRSLSTNLAASIQRCFFMVS